MSAKKRFGLGAELLVEFGGGGHGLLGRAHGLGLPPGKDEALVVVAEPLQSEALALALVERWLAGTTCSRTSPPGRPPRRVAP